MSVFQSIVEAVVPSILGAIRSASVSRRALSQSLRELADEIDRGEHIPDEALNRADGDAKVLDNLLANKT